MLLLYIYVRIEKAATVRIVYSSTKIDYQKKRWASKNIFIWNVERSKQTKRAYYFNNPRLPLSLSLSISCQVSFEEKQRGWSMLLDTSSSSKNRVSFHRYHLVVSLFITTLFFLLSKDSVFGFQPSSSSIKSLPREISGTEEPYGPVMANDLCDKRNWQMCLCCA